MLHRMFYIRNAVVKITILPSERFVFSLTKTSKKGLQFKQNLVEQIRQSVEKYSNIFVFCVQNMRNGKLKNLRGEWKDSRFFFCKNTLITLALGKSAEDEVQESIHKLTKQLQGQCGLLLTNKPKKEVVQWFKNYSESDYARSGFTATETVVLSEGPLPDFAHSIEPYLRQLGLPTSLQKGIVTLLKEHTVCTRGEVLNPEQARILKLLGNQMAEFKLTIKCVWSNDGTFKIYKRKDNLSDKEKSGTKHIANVEEMNCD